MEPALLVNSHSPVCGLVRVRDEVEESSGVEAILPRRCGPAVSLFLCGKIPGRMLMVRGCPGALLGLLFLDSKFAFEAIFSFGLPLMAGLVSTGRLIDLARLNFGDETSLVELALLFEEGPAALESFVVENHRGL